MRSFYISFDQLFLDGKYMFLYSFAAKDMPSFFGREAFRRGDL